MLRRFFNYLPLNNREKPPSRPQQRPGRPHRPVARHAGAGQPEQALRHQGADRQDRRRRRLLRAAARLREEHRDRLRPHGRRRRSASSPTSRWCWPAAWTSRAASRRRASCASATPSTSRSSPSSTCPASCPAPPGVRRHHQARRQAALRLCRVHGAEDHRHHPQGLRRRLRRDDLQAPARRRQLRLAERRDRGDGREGRGRDHLPRGEGRPGEARGARGRVQGQASPTRSSPARAASSTT